MPTCGTEVAGPSPKSRRAATVDFLLQLVSVRHAARGWEAFTATACAAAVSGATARARSCAFTMLGSVATRSGDFEERGGCTPEPPTLPVHRVIPGSSR